MKTPKQKPSHKHTTATKPNTRPTACVPRTPPRPLPLAYYKLDAENDYRGPLISLRAKFDHKTDLVILDAQSDNYRAAGIFLDHTQARAALYGLKESLTTTGRFQCGANFGRLQQFNSVSYTSSAPGPDLRVEPLPKRGLIRVCIVGSSEGNACRLHLYLTVLEAESLALDLEHALGDMERFANLDL